MAFEAEVSVELDAAEHERTAGDDAVDVVAVADAEVHVRRVPTEHTEYTEEWRTETSLSRFMGEQEFQIREVAGRGELRVGVRVFEERDGVAELLDGLGVVGDVKFAGGHAGVGAGDELAGENLGRLH